MKKIAKLTSHEEINKEQIKDDHVSEDCLMFLTDAPQGSFYDGKKKGDTVTIGFEPSQREYDNAHVTWEKDGAGFYH